MTKDEALKLALEALESCSAGDYSTGHVIHPSFDVDAVNKAIDAIDEALAQPEQEPVGLIESLKIAQPCCGEYETCWRPCTPRGKFLGQRDAQRKPLTDEEILSIARDHYNPHQRAEISFAKAIEAAHGIKEET